MDVSGYLNEVRRRAELMRRLRSLIYFSFFLSALLILPLVNFFFYPGPLWLLFIAAITACLLAFSIVRRFFNSSALRLTELTQLLDGKLATRGRVMSFTELSSGLESSSSAAICELIEEQLRQIDVAVSPADLIPYRLGRKEWFALLLTLFLAVLITLLTLKIAANISAPESIVDLLREQAEDQMLPPEVQEALEEIADQIESRPEDKQGLSDQVSKAEQSIMTAQQEQQAAAAENQTTAGKSEKKSQPQPTPSLAPSPTQTSAPSEGKDSVSAEQTQSAQDKNQSGDQGQDQKQEKAEDGGQAEQSSPQQGEKSEKGQKSEQESSEKSDQKQADQQGKGDTPSDEKGESGKEKGEKSSEDKAGKGSEPGEKEAKETGESGSEKNSDSGLASDVRGYKSIIILSCIDVFLITILIVVIKNPKYLLRYKGTLDQY